MSDLPLSFAVDTNGLIKGAEAADKFTEANLKAADSVDTLEKKSGEASAAEEARARRNKMYSAEHAARMKAEAEAGATSVKTTSDGIRVLQAALDQAAPKIIQQIDNGLRLKESFKAIGAEATGTAAAITKAVDAAKAAASTFSGGRAMEALSPAERAADMARRGYIPAPGGGWVASGGGGGSPPVPPQGPSNIRLASAVPATEDAMTVAGAVGAVGRIPALAAAAAAGLSVVGVAYAGLVVKANEAVEAQEKEARRLTTITGSREEANSVMRDSANLARELGASIAVATDRIVAFVRAGESLGGTREQMTAIAAVSEKLGQLSGASAGERNSAQSALAKMLAESKVNASDLAAVMNTVPQIADEIARGLGVSVSQLRLMAVEGKLTNEQVFGALLKQQQAVNEEFGRMPRTVGQSFQSIQNDVGELFTRFAGLVPLVREYRLAIELAAKAAKELNEATKPDTPQQRMDKAGGPTVYTDATNRIFRGAANPSAFYSAQYDQATADNTKTFAEMTAERDKALNDLLTTAKTVTSVLDPLAESMKALDTQRKALEDGIKELASGMTGLPAEEAAARINLYTLALQKLDEQQKRVAESGADAATKALRGVQQRAEDRANDPSPAGMTIAARVRELTSQPGVNQQQAEAAALAEQQERLGAIVEAKQREAEQSRLTLEAVRKGKDATVEAQVEAATLAFIWQSVGKNVEVSADTIKAFRDAVSEIYGNQKKTRDATAGANASKPLLDELASIAAAMKVVEQGAYAMRRAEAEAKAARSDKGTGKLQMEVFDAKQNLTDATTIANLKQEIDLTNKLAAAAGDVARQKQIQLEYDIQMAQRNAGPQNAAAIAEGIRNKAEAERQRQLAEGSASMEKQIEYLNEETALIRAGSADYTVQLAMLQKKRDLISQGADIENDAHARRQIELAGEFARAQQTNRQAQQAADEQKRIWQGVFDGIQKTGSDAFYDIFTGAGINASSVADSFKRIFARAFADIAAAAIIRPLIQPLFDMAGASGFIPSVGTPGAGFGNGGIPGAAGMFGNNSAAGPAGSQSIFGSSSVAYGQSSWMGTPGGGSLGGLSGMQMPSWLGGGQPFSFLKNTIPGTSGWFGTASAPGNSLGGSIASNVGGAGGITWGQGLGAAAGIGMGAYTLLSGKGSTSSTISGIGQMVGGAVSLIPGIGQVAGPLIALASTLLGGIIGDGGDKRTHSSTNASLRYGSGGYYTTGGAYGAGANSGQTEQQLRSVGNSLTSVFSQIGPVKDPSKMWGLDLDTWTAQGKDWSYTSRSTALVGPNGQREAWRMNMDSMMESGTAQVAIRSILSGAMGEISDNLKTALTTLRNGTDNTTLKDVSEGIDFVKVYDRLGKTITEAQTAVEAIDKQFSGMTESATKLGLAIKTVTDEQEKQRTKVATDFSDSIQRSLDDMVDPARGLLADLDKQKQTLIDTNKYLLENVVGAQDQILKIEELYGAKRAEVVEQSLAGLQSLIKRMSMGDLAGLSPINQEATTESMYRETLAKAQSGDGASIAKLDQIGGAYFETLRANEGSSARYFDKLNEGLAALQDVVARFGVGGVGTITSTGTATASSDISALVATNRQLSADLEKALAMLTAIAGASATKSLYA